MGPICYCPIGYELGMDELTCQSNINCKLNGKVIIVYIICAVCRGGYWGVDCSMTCDCSAGGAGNPCNNVDGSCICNSCWMGSRCEMSKIKIKSFMNKIN